MRAQLFSLRFPLVLGDRLVLEAIPCVSAQWIDTGLAEFKASVVPHGFFGMRLTHPAAVAVAGHLRFVTGLP